MTFFFKDKVPPGYKIALIKQVSTGTSKYMQQNINLNSFININKKTSILKYNKQIKSKLFNLLKYQ